MSLVRVCVVILCLAGCVQRAQTDTDHLIILVPGVSGDGFWYDGLNRGILDGRPDSRIETFSWGAPLPLFMLNFNNRSIHRHAEKQLARRISREAQPIDIIAHSAGCGVALGALRLLPGPTSVRHVVLLAPSVSPTYDLRPALAHMSGQIHAFPSERDKLFLAWRTSTFGTYDNVKTKAAGNLGFDTSNLPPNLKRRVIQNRYDPAWRGLGNDGSHDGALAREFAREIISPLLSLSRVASPP